MWGSFVLAAMFALILLYLPGYLLGRVYFSSSANSLAFAPVFTIALLVLLGVIAFPLSVSWFALPALAFLVSIIIFLIFRKPLAQGTRGSWFVFGAYVLMGALTTVVVFLANIDGQLRFLSRQTPPFISNALRQCCSLGIIPYCLHLCIPT